MRRKKIENFLLNESLDLIRDLCNISEHVVEDTYKYNIDINPVPVIKATYQLTGLEDWEMHVWLGVVNNYRGNYEVVNDVYKFFKKNHYIPGIVMFKHKGIECKVLPKYINNKVNISLFFKDDVYGNTKVPKVNLNNTLGLIKFIKSNPELAWYKDMYKVDLNIIHIEEQEAKTAFNKWNKKRTKSLEVANELDNKAIKILNKYINKLRDLGDNVSVLEYKKDEWYIERYAIHGKLSDYNNIVTYPGTYSFRKLADKDSIHYKAYQQFKIEFNKFKRDNKHLITYYCWTSPFYSEIELK